MRTEALAERVDAAVLPGAVQQARRAEHAHQHERIQHQHRTRHAVEPVVEEQPEHDREQPEDTTP